MSQSQEEALAASQAAKDALQSAANERFIAATDIQISAATAQGEFFVSCWTTDDIAIHVIVQYYLNLGYGVNLPELTQGSTYGGGPSNLFGELWVDFWTNGFVPHHIPKPYRLIISWEPNLPFGWPGWYGDVYGM